MHDRKRTDNAGPWLSTLPPAHVLAALPPQMRDLIDEMRRLKVEHGAAERERLDSSAGSLDVLAHDEDKRNAAEARRRGETISATPAADALRERRRIATLQVGAAEDAVKLATDDLMTTRDDPDVLATAHRAAATAHTTLTEAAAALAEAIRQAAAADALLDWLRGGPYDGRALLDVVTLAPEVGGWIVANPAPLDAAAVIERLPEALAAHSPAMTGAQPAPAPDHAQLDQGPQDRTAPRPPRRKAVPV